MRLPTGKSCDDNVHVTSIVDGKPTSAASTVITETCSSEKYLQACYHHSSAIKVNNYPDKLECFDKKERENHEVLESWKHQHANSGWHFYTMDSFP